LLHDIWQGHFNLQVTANCDIVQLMNNTHRKILNTILNDPINGNIKWQKIESLLLALGAVRTEKSGSAVSFVLNNIRADFHRPHPEKEALRYRVKDVRSFLKQAGIAP